MDTPTTNKKTVLIESFVASKQIYLFNMLKKRQFSGELILIHPNKGQWRFFMYLGRILYATGGEHSVRRWRRNLTAYLPKIAKNHQLLEKEISSLNSNNVRFCWEYELVSRWLSEGKVNREQVLRMLSGIMLEIFFDLSQAGQVKFYLKPDQGSIAKEKLLPLDANKIIAVAWQHWQKWFQAKLGIFSANKAPIIRQPQHLKLRTPEKTYTIFTKLLTGKSTIRDLAFTFKRDLSSVGSLLLPYIQQGYIELMTIQDLPSPVAKTHLANLQKKGIPLIACIDDSPRICQSMKEILQSQYRFLGITEPLKAIPEILEFKPDVIFLDLMMPKTNGYEICSSLRKLSLFRNTPIIILTSNTNMIHRMKSKMIGASDFMTKPVQPSNVLQVVNKHLNREKTNNGK